jgi:hypothetical protein
VSARHRRRRVTNASASVGCHRRIPDELLHLGVGNEDVTPSRLDSAEQSSLPLQQLRKVALPGGARCKSRRDLLLCSSGTYTRYSHIHTH